MNTLPEASGNAKQTHLQLNIHLTFGLEFEVSISFHVPGILYWDSCPDVSPLGCKGFVITVLCYILWRDWGPWRENCPVNCMKVWTPCPQALWGPSSTFTSSVFFSLRQYVRIQKSDTNNRVCDEKCQSSTLPSKPHSHPPKKLSCAHFFFFVVTFTTVDNMFIKCTFLFPDFINFTQFWISMLGGKLACELADNRQVNRRRVYYACGST